MMSFFVCILYASKAAVKMASKFVEEVATDENWGIGLRDICWSFKEISTKGLAKAWRATDRRHNFLREPHDRRADLQLHTSGSFYH